MFRRGLGYGEVLKMLKRIGMTAAVVITAMILSGCSPSYGPSVGGGAPPPSPTTRLPSTRSEAPSPGSPAAGNATTSIATPANVGAAAAPTAGLPAGGVVAPSPTVPASGAAPSPTAGPPATRGGAISGGSLNRSPVNGLSQSSKGGAVTIDVKWLGGEKGSFAFSVTMDTHSVDLDGYDLGKLASFRDNTGNVYRPTSWTAAAGGHHRSGNLIFGPLPVKVIEEAKYVELVIQDVAGVKERILRWELG
ncbi:MAG: hypothetical protein HYX92_06995 [Chloroflexi bacterium]|nr:hypothetical protein [Chloroflexota bacterium]